MFERVLNNPPYGYWKLSQVIQYSLFLSSHSVYQISWIFPIPLTYFTPYYLTGNQELNLHSILPPFTYWTQKKSFSWTYTSAHQEFWYSFNGYLILLSKPSFISDYQSYLGKNMLLCKERKTSTLSFHSHQL